MKKVGIVTHSHANFKYVMDQKIAENPREARKHLRILTNLSRVELGDTIYFYVHKASQLKGMRGYELEFHGLWYNMSEIGDIEKEYKLEKASR